MITQEDIDAFRDMTEDGAQEGYVYVITNKAWPEWVKIGRAIDANDRLRSYQTNSPLRDYWIVYSQYFEEGRGVCTSSGICDSARRARHRMPPGSSEIRYE